MNRRNVFTAVLMAGAGFALVSQIACQKNQVDMVIDSYTGEVVLHPSKGQVLKWSAKGDVAIHFALNESPCKSPNDPDANPCTVSVDQGMYLYTCVPECKDPQVVVGSDNDLELLRFYRVAAANGPAAAPRVAAPPIGIACDAKMMKIAITVDPVTAARGQSVVWVGLGGSGQPGYMKTWQIAFTPDICEAGVNQGQRACKIKMDAPLGDTPYTITSSDCMYQGMGKVTVQ